MYDRTSARAQNPDAKSWGIWGNILRLRHVEPARVPLRHATPSPPQLPDWLYWLVKEQYKQPPNFVTGHPHGDGKWEHRGDYAQEADPVRGICATYGGHETALVRGVRKTGGGHGLHEGPKKKWMRCPLDDLRAFGINADQWTTAAQDQGEWGKTAGQGANRFMVKWIAAEEIRVRGMRWYVQT